MLKTATLALVPKDVQKEFNKAIWAVAKQVTTTCNAEIRSQKKEIEDSSDSDAFSKKVKHFMDNPMSEEDQVGALNAIWQAQLADGELNTQFFEKYHKIVGVATEKDDIIQLVEFKDAFPSYAAAIEICHKEMPEV